MESALFKKLEDAVKEAMKAHDAVKRDCMRSVISEIKNATVNAGKELTDAVCMKMLQKSVKTHTDSIDQFSSAGRDDLVAKEKAELDILSSFLPKMLDASEVEAIVKDTINKVAEQLRRTIAKKDMGFVMKTLSSSPLAKSIDMKLASKITMQILN